MGWGGAESPANFLHNWKIARAKETTNDPKLNWRAFHALMPRMPINRGMRVRAFSIRNTAIGIRIFFSLLFFLLRATNSNVCVLFLHSCTVHLDAIESFIYPTDAQLDCSRNVKIYIKIYMRGAPTCFGYSAQCTTHTNTHTPIRTG